MPKVWLGILMHSVAKNATFPSEEKQCAYAEETIDNCEVISSVVT